jgi:hypothetical protein
VAFRTCWLLPRLYLPQRGQVVNVEWRPLGRTLTGAAF